MYFGHALDNVFKLHVRKYKSILDQAPTAPRLDKHSNDELLLLEKVMTSVFKLRCGTLY